MKRQPGATSLQNNMNNNKLWPMKQSPGSQAIMAGGKEEFPASRHQLFLGSFRVKLKSTGDFLSSNLSFFSFLPIFVW
jgi:hypothetical protein